MIGDVVFFKANDSFISKTIANVTKSQYTHVGLIIEYNNSTKIAKIIESNMFTKTKTRMIKIDEDSIIYTTGEKTNEQKRMILKLAKKYIGVSYDYWQIFGLLISLLFLRGERNNWFNNFNKFICSELMDIIYFKSGEKRIDNEDIGNITPYELIEKYNMYEKKIT